MFNKNDEYMDYAIYTTSFSSHRFFKNMFVKLLEIIKHLIFRNRQHIHILSEDK